jgi:hypothetical protein
LQTYWDISGEDFCTRKREITLYLRDALVLCSMKDNSSNKNEITAIIPFILYANRCDYSILIGCEVPDINYFLTLIKHYFFSQFYNYKKNKSLQIKAFIVNLNPDTDVLSTSVSFITRGGFRGGRAGRAPP